MSTCVRCARRPSSLPIRTRACLRLGGVSTRACVYSTFFRSHGHFDPRCRAKTTHSVVFLGFAEKTPRGPYIVGQMVIQSIQPISCAQLRHAPCTAYLHGHWIRRAPSALDLLPREAPPQLVELRGGADLARAARV